MTQETQINSEAAGNVIPKPDPTVQIVLACINILLCGSSILGIIALIFALIASSEKDYNEANSKLQIAKILNICGISLSIIGAIIGTLIFVGIFSFTGILALFL